MATLRTVIRLWVLSIFLMDGTAEEVLAFVGDDVLLLCPCTTKTKKVVWQADADIVNYFDVDNKENSEIHKSYMNRTQLFFHKGNGNCSLLLKRVLKSDETKYLCFYFEDELAMKDKQADLKVHMKVGSTPTVFQTTHQTTHGPIFTEETPGSPHQLKSGVSLGIPLTLAVIILLTGGMIMAFRFKRRRQRTKTLVVTIDTASAQPLKEDSPV